MLTTGDHKGKEQNRKKDLHRPHVEIAHGAYEEDDR